MVIVHDQDGTSPSAIRGINQSPTIPRFLDHTLDWSRIRTDNGDQSAGRNQVSKPDIDQFPRQSPLFNILDLLPDLLDLRLDVHHMAGNLQITAFGADGISLPIKLLN